MWALSGTLELLINVVLCGNEKTREAPLHLDYKIFIDPVNIIHAKTFHSHNIFFNFFFLKTKWPEFCMMPIIYHSFIDAFIKMIKMSFFFFRKALQDESLDKKKPRLLISISKVLRTKKHPTHCVLKISQRHHLQTITHQIDSVHSYSCHSVLFCRR